MPTKNRSKKKAEASEPPAGINSGIQLEESEPTGDSETTGRYLVLLREGTAKANVEALKNVAGVSAADSSDFAEGEVDLETLGGAQAMIFESLGVAVVDVPPDQTQALSVAAGDDTRILAMEPERIVYAIQDGDSAGAMADYLRGYRDAVNHLADKLLGIGADAEAGIAPAAVDESRLTWGLQATNVSASRFSGRGIRVAVLDTGLDLGHPDFAGRRITSQSFIGGETAQDGHGHGTHCIGTACGTNRPGRLPRYGIAFNSEIFAGKVLSNRGSGADGGIIAGINWAVTNNCTVISMSLGSRTGVGEPFSPVYEMVAKRALAAGSLILAAAGNDSRRPGSIIPVSRPANCPSILAVAALDSNLRLAVFSNGGINPSGGGVDIAGPGVDVLSASPGPRLTTRSSGTSMATPHVAGIAALLAEADPRARGSALWAALVARTRRLPLPSRDVGMGLVQAP